MRAPICGFVGISGGRRSVRLARTLTAARRRAGVWMVVSGRLAASAALSAAVGQGGAVRRYMQVRRRQRPVAVGSP